MRRPRETEWPSWRSLILAPRSLLCILWREREREGGEGGREGGKGQRGREREGGREHIYDADVHVST